MQLHSPLFESEDWFLKLSVQLQRLNHGILFQEWKDTYYKASTSLQFRERKLEDAANLIENNLILLGATAIEDKLQDQVSYLKYQELSSLSDGHATTTDIADRVATDMTIITTIPTAFTSAFYCCIQRNSVNSPICQHSTLTLT